MKFTITCCFLLIISGCYKLKEKTTAASIRTPHSYLWKGPFPKKLYYSSSISGTTGQQTDYHKSTEDMSAEWNDISKFVTFIEPQQTAPSSEKFAKIYEDIDSIRDGFNTVYLVDQENWPTDSLYALGVAVLLGRVNENSQYIIEEVDILIKANRTQYSTRTIILHELGHFLGLQHQMLEKERKDESVMYPEISLNDDKWYPRPMDIASLSSLYGISLENSGAAIRKVIPDGQGQTQRMIIELNADMNCRHHIEGVTTHSPHKSL